MTELLENDFLKIEISYSGAELQSVYNKQNQREYLWQGDKNWWPRRAPVLFPIVGKLNQNTYNYNGQKFGLPQHGFARDKIFAVEKRASNAVTFMLVADEESLAVYPFRFELRLIYSLAGKCLKTTYNIKNVDKTDMYFSIGAHPGFVCPLFENENFTDYYIQFEKTETLKRYLLEEGNFTGETELLPIKNNCLPLTDEVFIKDAIVLKNLRSKYLVLKSKASGYSLKFNFEGFPYFGIWKKPGAPFICLEPWCGLADYKGFTGDISQKEGINKLQPGSTFERSFSFELQP